LFNPDNPGNQRLATWAVAAAPKFAADVMAAPLRRSTNSHRNLIIELAARYRLPAIHALRAATADGGLMSYGVDLPDLFRQAAGYVDRILRGDKPADVRVQAPTKYELVINLKTAKALGLDVPPTLLARADEVIE
jgi:putative ABC transport system substrate-binding protein